LSVKPSFNDFVSEGGYGQQQVRKVVVPIMKILNNGYGQQQQQQEDVSISQPGYGYDLLNSLTFIKIKCS
jgi:hypothetical protein